MKGKARILIVVVFVLCAGVAAASSPLPAELAPDRAVSGSMLAQAGIPGTTFTLGRPSATLGTTPPGPSTGMGGSLTNPVLTGQNGTTVPGITPTPAAPTTPTAPSVPTIDQVVSLTRVVEVGAQVSAFTVPAGQHLVITDVLITNPAATPACGAAVSPSGATPTTGVIPPAAPTESGTGLLCVPAQTSLNLGLTTGLEFSSGQSVQLGNGAPAAATPGGPLHYHLRGFLMSPSGA